MADLWQGRSSLTRFHLMRKVSMIAARPLTYLTRMLVPGEPFDCDILFALISRRRGDAVLKEDAEARTRRPKSYRRRDLTAETR